MGTTVFKRAGDSPVEIELLTDGAAQVVGGIVRVRNGNNPGGPQLAFTRQQWEEFVAGIKAGEFEFPDA